MNKVIIIAEAGFNHNVDLAKAMDLVQVAANAGADYVKFQTFKRVKYFKICKKVKLSIKKY